MYDSIKEWVNVPVTVKPFKSRTGTGAKLFDDAREEKCYPKGEVTVVRNFNGIDVTSNNSLYFDGSVEISSLDVIIFEGEELSIQAINTFYRDGKPDIKVVYV